MGKGQIWAMLYRGLVIIHRNEMSNLKNKYSGATWRIKSTCKSHENYVLCTGKYKHLKM